MFGQPLERRLRSGRGALARLGQFWYPVRVIQCLGDPDSAGELQWRVRWWRGCEFINGVDTAPDSITVVRQADIIDSLWKLRNERRKIRVSKFNSFIYQITNCMQLGKWSHSWDIPRPEDIFDDLTATPYTEEIDRILSPAEEVLKKLFGTPASVNSTLVPAKEWLEKSKKPLTDIVPYGGSLSLTVRAQIMNWFEQRISKDKHTINRRLWMTGLPIAHAYTLYISALLKTKPQNQELSDIQLLQKAWQAQFSGIPANALSIDVDAECLKVLEEEMFEQSTRAGVAGNHQWGLDAGDHHYWSPYSGCPEHWNHGDRKDSECEVEVSSFICLGFV